MVDRNKFKYLNIIYDWDLSREYNIYIVYNRFIFSQDDYGHDYKIEAEKEYTRIFNMSRINRFIYLKKIPKLTINSLLDIIITQFNISRFDLEIYEKIIINNDERINRISLGKNNLNRLLTSINGSIYGISKKIPDLERLSYCKESDIWRPDTYPHCYFYTSIKTKKINPFMAYRYYDKYCFKSNQTYDKDENGNYVWRGNTPYQNVNKYIDTKINPDEELLYPNYNNINIGPDMTDECKENHYKTTLYS